MTITEAIKTAADHVTVQDRGRLYRKDVRWKLVVDGEIATFGTWHGMQYVRRELITERAAKALGIDAAALKAAAPKHFWSRRTGVPSHFDKIGELLALAQKEASA